MSDPHPERLRAFTTSLQYKLGYYDRAMRHLDRYLSTQFNVFNFIGDDENRLSDVLLDLLDPIGSHGQGDRFLELFHAAVKQPFPKGRARVSVRREVRTSRIPSQHRRIDLVIEVDDAAIAIENKPRARDQVNQIQDYAEYLTLRYGSKWRLIYLTPHGDRPSSTSIEVDDAARLRDQGQLVEMSFAEDLRGWVQDCIGRCDSDKYRWFLRDFLDYIVKTFPPSTTEAEHADPS